MFAYAGLIAVLASAAAVHADPVPTTPGPGDVFKEGGQCTFSWDVDTTGTWKEMNVELMTGDNWNMVHLTTVAKLDGTDASKATYSYDCPQVTPNSAVYFYQFTSPSSSNRTWTTRFAIGDADGNTTPEANSTQPDGQNIPWGLGQLVDPSTAVAAPSYLTGGSTGGASSGAQTTVVGPPAGTTAPADTTGAGASSPANSSPSGTPSAGSPSGPPASGAATGTNTTTGQNKGDTNGAMSALTADGHFARAVVALGVAALTFAVAL